MKPHASETVHYEYLANRFNGPTLRPLEVSMKAKHTPGPWHIHQATQTDGSYLILDRQDKIVGYTSSSNEAEANANLMAAAPDLYIACKRALDDLNDRDDDSLAFIRIGLDKAIAKAEGRE